MYLLTNGIVVTPQSLLENHEIYIEGSTIQAIGPVGTLKVPKETQVMDVQGGYIAPGFIDIHADFIETIASPRPTSVMDFGLSVREAERLLVTQGITTMFHSLSFYKKDAFGHKTIRESANVKRLLQSIYDIHHKKHLMRHRFHARFEIDNLGQLEELVGYLQEGKVQLLSFMDHSPGQGQYRDLNVYKETLKKYTGMSEARTEEVIKANKDKPKMTLEAMKAFADLAKQYGVSIASHDDEGQEKVDLVTEMGATISEFPITIETAQYAKEKGMYTVVGAPNILLGGSHSGNLSAAEAIVAGVADILCSDYYPTSLLHGIFQMHEKYQVSLVEMFNKVSKNPAEAVGMYETVGSLEVGKKADVLVIRKLDGEWPYIAATFVDGQQVVQFDYRKEG
ncbi:MAG: phosphonate metabolism protein PhnM [Cellulosilyticaceae bacterium]